MLSLARRDPLLCLYLIAAAALWLPGVFLDWSWAEEFGVSYVLHASAVLMGIGACLFRGGRSATASGERTFFAWIACALTAWLISLGLQYAINAQWGQHPRLALLGDGCYSLIYLFFLVAIEQRPHADPSRTDSKWNWRLFNSLGALVLVFALFAYFMVVPSKLDTQRYLSWVPSHYFYITLDICLAARLTSLAMSVDNPHWRRTYAWLAAAPLLWIGLDGVGWLEAAHLLAHPIDSWVKDAFWFLTPILIAVGARVRRDNEAPEVEPSQHNDFVHSLGAGSLLAHATLLLAAHVATEYMESNSAAMRIARAWVLLVALFALFVLAIRSHLQLRDENQYLSEEHESQTERARLSDRMASIGRLAGGIVHDFNNLLQIMRGCSEELVSRLKDEGDLRREAQAILNASEQGVQLTSQLLSIASTKKVQQTSVELNAAVARVVGLLRRLVAKDIAVEMQLAAQVGSLEVAPGQIEQALLNLGLNARDSIPGAGRIRFETRLEERQAVGGQWTTWAVVIVSDNGAGMTVEVRERIFEPFFTTKDGGTGLGLTIVQSLLEQTGGRVEVESRPGQGSRFCLAFPIGRVPGGVEPLATGLRAPKRPRSTRPPRRSRG